MLCSSRGQVSSNLDGIVRGDCRVMEFWNVSLVPPLSFKRRETRIGVKQAANRSMTFRRSALMFSLSIEGKKTNFFNFHVRFVTRFATQI